VSFKAPQKICYSEAVLTVHSWFNASFTSAPQGKNRAWKHLKKRQSIKCNYLSSVETGDQAAVSLIPSKTTLMQSGTADDPWEGGTDLTAHNSSHLLVSSSNNLKPEVFHKSAALATWSVPVHFLKMATALFYKLRQLFSANCFCCVDDHSSSFRIHF